MKTINNISNRISSKLVQLLTQGGSTTNEKHSTDTFFSSSAKIYAYRVDALHSETQKLNGTIQQNENEIENESEVLIRTNQRAKMKASSYLAMDLSSISLSSEFQFHPCQPTNFCRWTGGIGCDSLFADMISYTMYSSSDFPLLNGYIDFDTQMTDKFDGNEQILDIGLLRNVIQDNEGYDHVLGRKKNKQLE